jgi:hypothetical protein
MALCDHLSESKWARTLEAVGLGLDVILCDGSVCWNDSNIPGARTDFLLCRIGICALPEMKYHSITVSLDEISAAFDAINLHEPTARKGQIVTLIEAKAIAKALSLYPERVVESDSLSAVVISKALHPQRELKLAPRLWVQLAHHVAKNVPDGVGQIHMDETPGRNWLRFVPDLAP